MCFIFFIISRCCSLVAFFFGFLFPFNAFHFNFSSVLTCTYLVVYISIRVQTCTHPYALAYPPSLPFLHLHVYIAPQLSPCASLPRPFLLLPPYTLHARSA